MNICIIIPELPYPAYKNGSSVTLYNLINEWKKADITIFYYHEFDEDAEHYFEKNNIKVRHRPIYSDKPIRSVRSLFKPRNTWNYDFNKFGNIHEEFDLIYLVTFESSFLYKCLNVSQKTKVVFFELDCISLYYIRSLQNTSNLLLKVYFLVQSQLVKLFENRIYQKVNKVIFVSSIDKEYCMQRFVNISPNKFENITNGITENNLPPFSRNNQVLNIGFSGIFGYHPNFIAATFIVDNIIDNLIDKQSNVVIHLIGKNPPSKLTKYVEKYNGKLVVTGFVEDINAYLLQMDIYISPLFLGTGMKNKVLQAMNLGIPLICTSTSKEGISELVDNENCIICDSTNGKIWVDEILKLYNDKLKMNSFISKNLKIIEDNYRWDKIAKLLIDKSTI